MPKIKTKRNDIIRQKEVLSTLENAKEVGTWLQCLIALAWIFGKRISEILKLETDNVFIKDDFLYVRFYVLKKKTKRDSGIPRPYTKRITLKHPGVLYILRYLKTVEGALFPNMYYQKAQYYLKKVNKHIWWHLFRESLATEMAERGATEEQLLHWFDWDRVDTAHQYVKRGTKLTEELSDRTW